MSLLNFYVEFEAWRPGIVESPLLDDDFWVEDAAPAASALTLAPVPAQVPASGQVMVSGMTTPNVACGIAVNIGGVTIQRPAASNGSGEIYWLVSVPEGTAPGSGNLNASCGGAAVSAVFAVAG